MRPIHSSVRFVPLPHRQCRVSSSSLLIGRVHSQIEGYSYELLFKNLLKEGTEQAKRRRILIMANLSTTEQRTLINVHYFCFPANKLRVNYNKAGVRLR